MPSLTITKTYADGDTLFEADLDNIKDDLENFLNVTKINDDNIQSAGITGSTKLVDASVSSAKIASAAVTTSKINDLAVTTAKLDDLGVTTAKLAASSVTQAKRAALGQQLSAASGEWSSSSAGEQAITNMSVALTTTGRPVHICFVPSSGVVSSYITVSKTTVNTTIAPDTFITIKRDGTAICMIAIGAGVTMSSATLDSISVKVPSTAISMIDVPSAGAYTYTAFAQINTSSIVLVYNVKLLAYEL